MYAPANATSKSIKSLLSTFKKNKNKTIFPNFKAYCMDPSKLLLVQFQPFLNLVFVIACTKLLTNSNHSFYITY